MKSSIPSTKESQPRPENPRQSSEHVEEQLDNALDDTFPASDPPAPVTPDSTSQKRQEDALDEALEDSFPASDPPSTTQPG